MFGFQIGIHRGGEIYRQRMARSNFNPDRFRSLVEVLKPQGWVLWHDFDGQNWDDAKLKRPE